MNKKELRNHQVLLFNILKNVCRIKETKTHLVLEFDCYNDEQGILPLPQLIKIAEYFQVPYEAVNVGGYGQSYAYSEWTAGHDDYCIVTIDKSYLVVDKEK